MKRKMISKKARKISVEVSKMVRRQILFFRTKNIFWYLAQKKVKTGFENTWDKTGDAAKDAGQTAVDSKDQQEITLNTIFAVLLTTETKQAVNSVKNACERGQFYLTTLLGQKWRSFLIAADSVKTGAENAWDRTGEAAKDAGRTVADSKNQ